jgi:hypothetical protein
MVGTLQADRVGASINVDAGLRGSVQAAQEHLQMRAVVVLSMRMSPQDAIPPFVSRAAHVHPRQNTSGVLLQWWVSQAASARLMENNFCMVNDDSLQSQQNYRGVRKLMNKNVSARSNRDMATSNKGWT